MCEIVQGTSGRQLLTDLGHRRVGGIPSRPTNTREAAIAGVEMSDDFTEVLGLGELEPHVPVACCGCHDPILVTGRRRRKGHRSPGCTVGSPVDAPPVIDLAPVLADPAGPDGDQGADTRAAIHRACLHTGFFVVVGHGLDEPMTELFAAARRFFALPQTDKEAVPRHDRYGYVPYRPEAIDAARASERTEFLEVGLHDEVVIPDWLTAAVRPYQRAAMEVAGTLLRLLAVQLGASAGFFADRMGDPQCRLRFLHYPAVAGDEGGDLPVPTLPHTDYGALTLLATDGVPGLEVRPIDGPWTPVVAPAGSLVVNLGDMLARWTNDVYRSTVHRVVGPARGDRLSIPFFVNPDPATVVECLPACVTADRPCAYEPVTAGEFLRMRIDGSAEPYADPTDVAPRR